MYLTDSKNVEAITQLTGLSEDELECYVGRFKKDHHAYAGMLKGEAVVHFDRVVFRHHFTKKLIFTFDL